eukprot:s1717_g5.t1
MGASLQLCIGQKYVTVLECLQTFLHREIGCQGTVCKRSGFFDLAICTTSTCKHILEKLLLAGMARKAAQAELALSLDRQNAAHVRSAMAKMTGNQMFGKGLDGDGLERARTIKLAQQRAMRLRQRGLLQAADALLAEVEVLKAEHGLLKAQHENRQLHEYMHKLESMTLIAKQRCAQDQISRRPPYQVVYGCRVADQEELRSLREERTAKDATIDFLKTKIATLQNRLAVESLQGSGEGEDLQQSLETERRRNEEMSRELQHAALEIDDLRTELKEARAEVASLQAEMERLSCKMLKSVQHANSNENHNGVLKEHNVLIASVEELERELAQEPLIGLRCRSRDLPKLISVIFATTPAAITTRLAESPDANLL